MILDQVNNWRKGTQTALETVAKLAADAPVAGFVYPLHPATVTALAVAATRELVTA